MEGGMQCCAGVRDTLADVSSCHHRGRTGRCL